MPTNAFQQMMMGGQSNRLNAPVDSSGTPFGNFIAYPWAHPGLTGLDPKFFQDPRFDYEARMGNNPEEVKGAPVVLMGNRARDDYDSAPVGVKSTLAVDEPTSAIMAEMQGKSEGPSPWFTAMVHHISKGGQITPEMAEEMRRQMLMTRDRIEDRF